MGPPVDEPLSVVVTLSTRSRLGLLRQQRGLSVAVAVFIGLRLETDIPQRVVALQPRCGQFYHHSPTTYDFLPLLP